MIDRDKIERQVLSACLIFDDALLEISRYVKTDSFENKDYKDIFVTFKELESFNEAIDAESVCLYLQKNNKDYLTTLVLALSSESVSKNYELFAKELNKLELLKAQKKIGLKLIESADKNELVEIDEAFLLVNEINAKNSARSFKELADEMAKEDEEGLIESGIKPLDEFLGGGIALGQFIVVLGEPEVGKTSFVTQMLEHRAKFEKVVFFCFEFTYKQYVKQTMQRDPLFYPSNASEELWVDYTNSNISDLVREIRNHAKNGVRFFVVDSQMKIGVNSPKTREEEETKKFSHLAKLCHSLGIVIVLIAQTNRTHADTPAGSKQGEYEANILISIRHNRKKRKDGTYFFERDSRKLFFVKNKQNGRSKVEIKVGFDVMSRTYIPYKVPTQDLNDTNDDKE